MVWTAHEPLRCKRNGCSGSSIVIELLLASSDGTEKQGTKDDARGGIQAVLTTHDCLGRTSPWEDVPCV